MVDFTAGYTPPGVYVQTQTSGSTGVVGIGNTVVCLFGRGRGYQTYTENITFANGNTVALSQLGIDASSIVVTGTVAGVPTTFQLDGGVTPHDYSVTQTNGSNTNSATSIVRTASGTIPVTGTVTVSYHYTPASYFALNNFADYATFATVYGPALDPVTGAVVSPLSLAAQMAFQNGANVIYAVALSGQGTTLSQYEAAYALTNANYDINLMVPLFEDAVDAASAGGEITQLATFINDMASNQSLPRMALIGLAKTFSGSGPDTLASSINNKRIVLVYPQVYNYFNPVTNTTVTVDGFYAAAACSGFLANNAPNQGLTRAQVRGFTGIPTATLNAATLTNKNLWSSKGVSVIEINRLGQMIVRHGVTTSASNVGTREISLVRCQDALFELMQVTLDASEKIGDSIGPGTSLEIKSLVAGALETALANGTIRAYKDLLVSQQTLPSGDPTVIEVTFSYFPTYPLNYITVTFTLDLSTGNIQTETADTAGGGSNSISALQSIGGI